MKISEFTLPEIEYFMANCNFVNLEIEVFDKRAKGIPLEEIV